MRGYAVSGGYMGYVPQAGRYLLFATEVDYWEYMDEAEAA